MSKILITGGTGFLGQWTSKRLKSLNHDVTVIGRNKAKGQELQTFGIRFVEADITDSEKMSKGCEHQEIVIHCAALASPWGKYEKFYSANVVGTNNLISACLHQNVRRLINISTPSVYFDWNHGLNIRETDPLPKKQATNYATTKLMADQEIERAAKKGLEVISLRPRAIFGPGDQNILGRVIRAANKGTVPLVNGGKSYVDMTYVDNVVDAILLSIDAPSQLSGRTFNITNGEPRPTKEILALLFEKLGLSVRVRILPFPVAYAMAALIEFGYSIFAREKEPPLTRYSVGLMSRSQTLDISLAREELGYQPKVTLEEGLDIYAKWWKENYRGAPA